MAHLNGANRKYAHLILAYVAYNQSVIILTDGFRHLTRPRNPSSETTKSRLIRQLRLM